MLNFSIFKREQVFPKWQARWLIMPVRIIVQHSAVAARGDLACLAGAVVVGYLAAMAVGPNIESRYFCLTLSGFLRDSPKL